MAMPARGAMTFLFTDIEGSTRRWREDPSMGEILTRHDAVVSSALAQAGGRIVKHTGDGVFAVFGDAGAAVRAAAAIQVGIGEAFENDPIGLRIGVHSGQAHERDGDLFGLDVSTAARIMGAGHGGQVLVSEAAKVLSGALDGVEFRSLGLHRLKDLGEPQPLYQVMTAGLRTTFPPPRTLEVVEHNFPLQLTSFVGREAQVDEVADLVRRHRLVTVTGVGGAGKTRMTLQAAAELIDTFANGARFVELAPVTDPAAVPVAVASVLGVRHERGQIGQLLERVSDELRSSNMLLVIDNCEHLLSAVAGFVSHVLTHAPDVHVLASSREGLGIPGERLWQVPSLEVGEDRDSEAVRLFLDRAAAVAPQLEWNDETRDHIVRICRLLDGMPLAIELAAARVRVLSPEQISQRLSDRFRLLTGGSRAALPRQQTLEATVDWSYRLLGPGERKLFTRLAVFSGGFDLDAVESVCADADVGAADVLDHLTGLVDRSMVLVEYGEAGVARYRLLETLRQFGLQRLGDSEEITRWKQRHLEYFHRELHERDIVGWDLNANARWLGMERANLLAALDWATVASGTEVPILAVGLALDHLNNLGDPENALAMVELAAAHQPEGTGMLLRIRAIRLRILHVLGRMESFVQSWEELAPQLDAASDEDAAWCLCRMASVHAWDPELDVVHAVELAREAVKRAETAGTHGRFLALLTLAIALMWRGDSGEETTTTLRQTVELGRELDDPGKLMAALSTLVIVVMTADQRDGSDLTAAVEDEMFEIWERSGRAVSDEYILWGGLRRGWWDFVDREIARLEPELRGVGRVWMLMPLAVLRMMQGRLDEADDAFDEVAALGPIRRWHHDYYPCRAEVAAMRGDREAVAHWMDEHRRVPMEQSERVLWLATLRAVVRAHIDAGDVTSARAAVQEMRALGVETSVPAVQLGSPAFYLSAAEAELTRATGPDAEAWARAENLAMWRYWTLYCRVRRLEAHIALSGATGTDHEALRDEVRSAGAMGLVDLIDSVVG